MISSKSQKAYAMGKQLCTALRVPNRKMTIVDTLQDYTITKKLFYEVFLVNSSNKPHLVSTNSENLYKLLDITSVKANFKTKRKFRRSDKNTSSNFPPKRPRFKGKAQGIY